MTQGVLLTCFGPFGPHAVNPTEAITDAVARSVGCRRRCLPTSLVAAPAALLDALATPPVAVVATGLAATRSQVTVERIASNLADFEVEDVDGARPRCAPVVPDGPDEWLTAVDLPGLVQAIERTGVPVAISDSAGTYVCNALYFHLLGWARPRGVPAVFVHLPPLDLLPLHQQVEAVAAAVQYVASVGAAPADS